MLIDDDIREMLHDAAAARSIPELMEPAIIGHEVARRGRRRRAVGGFATVLVVVLVTLGVGLFSRPDTPSAVFAGEIDGPFTPRVVTATADGYVALAAIDPFEFDELRNATSVVVTSSNGSTWDLVEDAPVVVGTTFAMAERDGTIHIVGSRGIQSETADSDEAEITHEFVHLTSDDLESWTESDYPLPAGTTPEGQFVAPQQIAFLDDAVLIGASRTIGGWNFDDDLDELGLDHDSICEMDGTINQTRLRVCGTTEVIKITRTDAERFVHENILLRLDDAGLSLVELPAADDVVYPLRPWSSMYQADDAVGISGYQTFETTNGTDWEPVEIGGEFGVHVAVRGSERFYVAPQPVARFGPEDPIKGMGYSTDGGASWEDIRIDHLFADQENTPRWYSSLTAAQDGWLMVAMRTLRYEPEVIGVERNRSGASDFTMTADGFVLEGRVPYGEAELRDPDGVVVRTWEQLEVENPIWSGFEIVDGDVVAVDETTGERLVTFTAVQWATLINPLHTSNFDLLFSANGRDWSIIDSSASSSRVLAIRDGQALVQRFSIGHFASTPPPVDVIELPTIED